MNDKQKEKEQLKLRKELEKEIKYFFSNFRAEITKITKCDNGIYLLKFKAGYNTLLINYSLIKITVVDFIDKTIDCYINVNDFKYFGNEK